MNNKTEERTREESPYQVACRLVEAIKGGDDSSVNLAIIDGPYSWAFKVYEDTAKMISRINILYKQCRDNPSERKIRGEIERLEGRVRELCEELKTTLDNIPREEKEEIKRIIDAQIQNPQEEN